MKNNKFKKSFDGLGGSGRIRGFDSVSNGVFVNKKQAIPSENEVNWKKEIQRVVERIVDYFQKKDWGGKNSWLVRVGSIFFSGLLLVAYWFYVILAWLLTKVWQIASKVGSFLNKVIKQRFQYASWRSRVSFVLVILISSVLSVTIWLAVGRVFDLKDQVVKAASGGLQGINEGINNLKAEKFDAAAVEFDTAARSFDQIRRDLERLGQGEGFLINSLPGEEYQNVQYVMEALISLSRAAKFISLGLDEVSAYGGGDFSKVISEIMVNENSNEEIFAVSERTRDYFNTSLREAQNAIDLLAKVDKNRIPKEYMGFYEDAMTRAPRYLDVLKSVDAIFANFDTLLGRNVPAKYLFLFQNNNELRPTGGFIGSYGIATFKQGRMSDLFFDDIYNPDGQMQEVIEPPYPINKMTNQWAMRDSNWNPDFQVSADQAVKMYEKEGGFTVDGVVAFTPEIIKRLLKLTGPVEMPDYGVTLTEENFTDEVQKEVELEYDKAENKPKKILADLLPVLMERMGNLDDEQKVGFWQMILDLLNERQIMFFSYNGEMQDLIAKVGWAGKMKETEARQDYLSMVHANIGGRKSDSFIKESVKQAVSIQPDGSIVEELSITRKNTEDWSWPNWPNYDYLRVYLPKGSELLEVKGFANPEGMVTGKDGFLIYETSKGEATTATTKVYEENGKTVFANWIVTDPWEISSVSYRYKLPYKLGDLLNSDNNMYNLYLQKQAGRGEIDYIFKFDPGVWQIRNARQGMSETNGQWLLKNDLKKDLNVEMELKR